MASPPAPDAAAGSLAAQLRDARARTHALTADLSDAQWRVPRLPIVNPLLWELGHLGWFQELWTLRQPGGLPPLLEGADALYDSARVPHGTRWDLPLPERPRTLAYLDDVLRRSLEALSRAPAGRSYFHQLALFHEDMHGEAFLYTRQTLGYPAPQLGGLPAPAPASGDAGGDVEIAGARFLLGAPRPASAAEEALAAGEAFVFDNEKWAHPVEVATFRIARAPVTCGQFAEFVEAGGYRDDALWSPEGLRFRARAGAALPAYWRRAPGGGFLERRFDAELPLREDHPVIHVSWFEAEAYCRWARRRLPTEAEWELAAASPRKRRFPWGDAPPDARLANLDARAGWTVPVGAHAAGDSPEGCRQLVGNVWEWTASDFAPYPGFVADPYKEYSAPWFESPHKVLRGGCWATRGRLLRNTWRNFYPPDRRDVLAGFRTCAR